MVGEWLRRLRSRAAGVRMRATFGAVPIVAVALLVASLGMLALLRESFTDNVRAGAFARADTVVSLVEQDGFSALESLSDEEFIQVVGPRGEVVAATRNVAGEDPIARPAPGESVELSSVPFEDEPFIVVARSTGDRSQTVLVGRGLDDAFESVGAVAALLAIGLPALLVVIGYATWVLVGRALAPVDAIGEEVDEISMGQLHRRVPVPETNDEIQRLASRMNRMLHRLEEGDARQRRFVADASHELRSPVASIRQHAEVALRHPDVVAVHELAETVLLEGLRLQRLVEDLLLLARMGEQGVQASARPVDLDDVVFSEIDRTPHPGARAVDASGVSGAQVVGDRRQLERMVSNLLDNAARHAKGAITIRLASENGSVVLTIEDDGPGIPPDDRARVFRRFERVGEARSRDSGGAGLGLAIVAEVAAAHGGKVTIGDSSLGGARLEVRLPAA